MNAASEVLRQKLLEKIDAYDGSDSGFTFIVSRFLETGNCHALAIDLANRAGVSYRTVSNWSRGMSHPNWRGRPSYIKIIRDMLTAP